MFLFLHFLSRTLFWFWIFCLLFSSKFFCFLCLISIYYDYSNNGVFAILGFISLDFFIFFSFFLFTSHYQIDFILSSRLLLSVFMSTRLYIFPQQYSIWYSLYIFWTVLIRFFSKCCHCTITVTTATIATFGIQQYQICFVCWEYCILECL